VSADRRIFLQNQRIRLSAEELLRRSFRVGTFAGRNHSADLWPLRRGGFLFLIISIISFSIATAFLP
jgi:hypothetical protein